MAEPPIFANEFAGSSFGETIFDSSNVFGGWDNNIGAKEFVFRPVGRKSNLLFNVSLQTFDHAQDFCHVAAEFLGVVENAADFAFWVNDENGTDGVGVVVLTWVDEAKTVGNSTGVGDDGELDFGIEMLFDPFSPFDMREDLVNTETEQFAVEIFESLVIFLERNEFGGANWGEIGWMAEKDEPFAGIITG